MFARALRECDAISTRIAGWSILDELLADDADSRIQEIHIAMVANFCVQVGLYELWALLVTSVIMSMNESACVGLTIAFFLAFYVISAITFPSTYTVYVLGERIAYIDNPTLGMVAVIPGTTILLYFYLAMAFAFCHCFTKIFPKGCEFYFAF